MTRRVNQKAEYELQSIRPIMKGTLVSRRRCLQVSALVGCSLLLGGQGLAEQEPLPAEYIRPEVEVASLIGDIGLINGKPAVHAHAVLGFPDGTTRSGHVISATIWPTLELFLTDEPAILVKEDDPETDLFLFDPKMAK
jgi:hypothetical protein